MVSVKMYPSKSYSKRYISKEQVIFARTQLETMSPNDDKYLVQWETRSTKSRKLLNFLTPKPPQKILPLKFENIYRGCSKNPVTLEPLNGFLSNKNRHKLQELVFQTI